MKVITVSNIKGGVAKTTTASTMAAGLHRQGRRVLMIDSDPQMNLSMCFVDNLEDDETIPSLHGIYASGMKIDDVKQQVKPGLDLVIGDFNLCSADMEFLGKVGSLKFLSKAVKAIAEPYDYVIIDTPPNLGFLTLNAFMVSDYILTPMAADLFSMKAIRLLKKTIDSIAEDADKNLPVVGTLVTRYTGRTNVSKALEDSISYAAELLDTKTFSSRIRHATIVMESQLLKTDLFEYAPKAPVTKDYEAFLIELLERIEG